MKQHLLAFLKLELANWKLLEPYEKGRSSFYMSARM
jgi:hypothetical protein